MPFDNNGKPGIDNAVGVFTGIDVQNNIRNVETPEVSISSLIETVLREMSAPAEIVIDPI